jgi:methylated-DNA-[protein]-cysteine S-methyltransferase
MRGAAEGEGLFGLWFTGQKYFPQGIEGWKEAPDHPVFKALRDWLQDYFSGKNPPSNFNLAPRGTDFQRAVWKMLLAIPYGQVSSYGKIAGQLPHGTAMSARAVGGAVGHNPISLLIPCHRVLRTDGSLCGYAGGIDKKKALLSLEGTG